MKKDEQLDRAINSSKRRMPVILGGLLFAGFLLTTSIGYLISRHSIRASILQNELPLSSNNIYSEIQRDLFEPILISSLMANDTFVKDWLMQGEQDPGAIIRYLDHIQEKYGTTTFLVSEASRKYYNAKQILKVISETYVDDAWFFRVRQMKPDYEINVDPDQSDNNAMTIFINYRVLDKAGNFLGATGVGLNVKSVKTLMQEYRKRYHRDVYFYDRKGKLVLHGLGNEPNEIAKMSDHNSEEAMRSILARIAKGETDITASATGRNGAMASYRYIPELDWILVVEQVSDGTRSILLQTIGLNLLVGLLTSGILLGITRKTTLSYQNNIEAKNRDLILRKAQLLEANAARERLFSIIGHDLRGPVGSVKATLDSLSSGLLDPETFHAWSEELRVQVDHVLVTLENLLQWGSLQASSLKPRFEKVNLRTAAQDGISLLDSIAKNKSIRVENGIPENAVVWADTHQIQTVMRNFLSNAIKFTPEGGNVRFSAMEIPDAWKVSIQDSGIGIDAERASRFTHPGNEYESTLGTDNERGLGLGLQLCRDFIYANKGTFSIESAPGRGTTVSFTLPTGSR
jgi:signal transduction histidine kinase